MQPDDSLLQQSHWQSCGVPFTGSEKGKQNLRKENMIVQIVKQKNLGGHFLMYAFVHITLMCIIPMLLPVVICEWRSFFFFLSVTVMAEPTTSVTQL